MKSIIKKNSGLLIAFTLTIMILLIVFKLVGIIDHSIIIIDLEEQVYPLINYFRNIILSGDFSLFSFNIGFGESIFGIVYYYLMSPFNILALFIKNMNTFFITIIILKSAFASVFCYLYLRYQFKKEEKLYLIIFSLLYALSSYFLSYNMLVEFLDVYMIFPLVLLGIDKIVKENKTCLYIVSLILAISFNYYLSYMVIIFSFLYFNYKLLCNKMDLKKRNIDFIIINGLIVLIASIVLLPIISEIGSYSHENSSLFGGEPLKIIISLKDVVNYYILGRFKHISVLNVKSFYIYTSIITIPLIYFYFINDKFSKREKIFTGLFLLILLVSISINYMNYIWHGFVPPCCFNGRFTFMFILFILMICMKSLYYIKEFPIKHYLIVFFGVYFTIFIYSIIEFPRLIDITILLRFLLLYVFVVSISLICKKYNISIKYYLIGLCCLIPVVLLYSLIFKSNIYLNIGKLVLILITILLLAFINKSHDLKSKHFLILIIITLIPISFYSFGVNYKLLEIETYIKIILLLIIIILIRYIPKNKRLKLVLLLVLIIELFMNNYGYLYRFKYKKDLDNSYEDVINYIKQQDKSIIYRIDDNYPYSIQNYGILYNYYGIDYFMSTMKKDLVDLFAKLNARSVNDAINSINYDGSIDLLSSLLGVKYYIENLGLDNNSYTKFDSVSKYDIYKNEDSLEYGYVVDDKIIKIKDEDNGLEYINSIYKSMSNNDNNVVERVELDKINNGFYKFKNTQNKDFYLLIDFNSKIKYSYLNVYINNKRISNNNNIDNLFKITNDYNLDEDIEIKIRANKKIKDNKINVYVYYLNQDIYKEDINILKENQLKVTKIGNNYLKGRINSNKDGLLFLTCHYDDNMDLYVDGKKVDKIKVLNAFMGTNISKGKHTVVLKYKPKILYLSFIPSLIGLILLIIYVKIRRKNK